MSRNSARPSRGPLHRARPAGAGASPGCLTHPQVVIGAELGTRPEVKAADRKTRRGRIGIKRPVRATNRAAPDKVTLALVVVIEIAAPVGAEPLAWQLLTPPPVAG